MAKITIDIPDKELSLVSNAIQFTSGIKSSSRNNENIIHYYIVRNLANVTATYKNMLDMKEVE